MLVLIFLALCCAALWLLCNYCNRTMFCGHLTSSQRFKTCTRETVASIIQVLSPLDHSIVRIFLPSAWSFKSSYPPLCHSIVRLFLPTHISQVTALASCMTVSGSYITSVLHSHTVTWLPPSTLLATLLSFLLGWITIRTPIPSQRRRILIFERQKKDLFAWRRVQLFERPKRLFEQ